MHYKTHHKHMIYIVFLYIAATLFALGCKPEIKSTGGDKTSPTREASLKTTDRPPYAIGDIDLVTERGHHPDAPTGVKTRLWLRDALAKSPEFQGDSTGAKARATVSGSYRASWEDASDDSGQRLGAVYYKLTLRTRDAEGKTLNRYNTSAFIGEALPPSMEGGEALRALVKKVTQEVADSLVVQVRVDFATKEEMIGFLAKTQNLELLKATIPKLRTQKVREAAPAMLPLLEHKEREIVNLTASALGDLGTRDMIPALIKAGTRVDATDRLPVLYALGELGGPEALVYLQTLRESARAPAMQQAIDRAIKRASESP